MNQLNMDNKVYRRLRNLGLPKDLAKSAAQRKSRKPAPVSKELKEMLREEGVQDGIR